MIRWWIDAALAAWRLAFPRDWRDVGRWYPNVVRLDQVDMQELRDAVRAVSVSADEAAESFRRFGEEIRRLHELPPEFFDRRPPRYPYH